MYRYYKKHGYNIMDYEFDSLRDLTDYLISAPYNKHFKRRSSQKSGDVDFYGEPSFESAMFKCRYGDYGEGFKKLNQLKIDLDKFIKEHYSRPRQFNDYIGYSPDVASYLQGSPINMFNRAPSAPYRKVNIYYNVDEPHYVSKERIYNKGAITLSIIDILEDMGINTSLCFFDLGRIGDEVFYSKVQIKQEDQPLDIRNAFFPMCNAAFLRRMEFNLREKCPNITRKWEEGYGYPCELDEIKLFTGASQNDIIISTTDEMDVMGRDIVKDANKVFDFINRNSDIRELGVELGTGGESNPQM